MKKKSKEEQAIRTVLEQAWDVMQQGGDVVIDPYSLTIQPLPPKNRNKNKKSVKYFSS